MRRIPTAASGIILLCSFATSCGFFESKDATVPESRESWVDAILAAEDRRDASDPLLALALERDDPVVRMFAYRAFGRIADPGAIPIVVNATTRELEAELRAEAVLAIGGTESARVLDAVEPFALDSSFVVRRAVARAIGRARSDQSTRMLFELLADADPDVRAEAAYGIARRVAADKGLITARTLPAFRALADTALGDSNPGVRAAAAYALGKTEQPEFAPAYTNALTDEDPLVRCFAAVALQTIDYDVAARDALIAATRDPRFTIVVEAAKALERSPSAEVVVALCELLPAGDRPGHASFHARAAAIRTLGRMAGFSGALDASRAALADPSPSVRAEALDAFAALAPPELALAEIVRVATASGSPESVTDGSAPFVRSRAAGAAASLASEAGFGVVAGLLDDPEPAVRAAAIATLPKFKSRVPETGPRLAAALAEHDVAPRESAATAIAELGLDSLTPQLAAALADSAGSDFIEARIAILKALGGFGKFSATEVLRTALDDDELEVRRVAAEQIARLGGLVPKITPKPAQPPVVIPRAGRDFLTATPRPRISLVTSKGTFEIELLVEDAPVHAKAFLERCRQGFYDGLLIHRLVPGFVVQGLDPRGDGYGSGGASLRSEANEERYGPGSVGTPDAGGDTGGCQIFVTFRAQPRLDDRYTIFARVVGGMDVVEQLDVGDRVLYVLAPAAKIEKP